MQLIDIQGKYGCIDKRTFTYHNTNRHTFGGSMEKEITKKLFTIEEFAKAYCLSRTKAFSLLKNKKLKAVRMGTRRMIRLEDAEDWKNNLPVAE